MLLLDRFILRNWDYNWKFPKYFRYISQAKSTQDMYVRSPFDLQYANQNQLKIHLVSLISVVQWVVRWLI